MKSSVFLVFLMVIGCTASEFDREKELIREILAIETRHLLSDDVKAELNDAYLLVRDDNTDITWLSIGYNGKELVSPKTGNLYGKFLDTLADDNRVYGYVRFETGNDMFRQAKFAFITWIGPLVSPLKKAKVSTDKAFVKIIIQRFGKEILADELRELREDTVLQILLKASRAAYGTGRSLDGVGA